MTEAMAVTHAITWLKEEKDGKIEMNLVGDPLDVKMFECTEWILDEENTTEFIAQRMHPKDASLEYRISLLRRFDFTSQLMRASSIVMYDVDKIFRGFVKGAPEKLRDLCK
jgi:cation-transporting ATPase 13A3/4/5